MDGWLRQSTAVTVPIGPFVDSANGDDEEVGLTIAQADVRLSKNGGSNAQKNNSTSASHEADGMYLCPLSTTDTNTLGQLVLWVHVAGALFAKHVFMILPANVYDSLVAGSDNLEVDLVLWRSTQPNTLTSGRVEGLVGAMANNVLAAAAIASDAFTTAKFADGFFTAAKFASGALDAVWSTTARTLTAFSTSLAVSVWDVLASAVAAANSIGLQIKTNLDAAVSSRATPAQVATELGTYDGPTNAEMVARTLAAASYATASAQATTDGKVDSILEDTGTTLPATLATIDTNVDSILEDTGTTLPATLSTLDGKLDTIDNLLDTEIGAIITSLGTISGYLDTEIAAILADTNELQLDWANGGRLDLLIDGITTLATAIKAVTDALPDAGALTSKANEATLTSTGRGDPSALAGALGSSLSPLAKLDWILAAIMRPGEFNKTTGEQIIKNAAGTDIAKAIAADDGTTTERGAYGAP